MAEIDKGELIVATVMFADTLKSVNESTEILTEAAYAVAAEAEKKIEDLETEANLYRALGQAIFGQSVDEIESAVTNIAEAGV